jgi:hypothetical protein
MASLDHPYMNGRSARRLRLGDRATIDERIASRETNPNATKSADVRMAGLRITHNARTIWASPCGRFYVAGTGSPTRAVSAIKPTFCWTSWGSTSPMSQGLRSLRGWDHRRAMQEVGCYLGHTGLGIRAQDPPDGQF